LIEFICEDELYVVPPEILQLIFVYRKRAHRVGTPQSILIIHKC